MPGVCHENGWTTSVLSLSRALFVLVPWLCVTSALPEAEKIAGFKHASRDFALIPSAPVPLSAIRSSALPSLQIPGDLATSSFPPNLIPSVPVQTDPSTSTPGSLNPGIIPSANPSFLLTTLIAPDVSTTSAMPTRVTTIQALRPIPAPTTVTGDPDGHKEIPEPNFTVTSLCRGCSPVVAIPATGWGDNIPSWATLPAIEPTPAADLQGTTQQPPQAVVTAGPTEVIISQEPSGNNFVVGTRTIKPGETVVVDNTPIVIRTTAGNTQIIVGTRTVPLVTPPPVSPYSQVTEAPSFLPVTVDSHVLTPIFNTATKADAKIPAYYIVAGQTVLPGGSAVTISGTTLSLLPTPTAIVVNGQTSTLSPSWGDIFTTTMLPKLTLWNHVYTANRAGYYSIAPGTTLVPGAPAITVSGTAISLEAHGTAIIVQGSTSEMAPQTTIVTTTRNPYLGVGGAISSTGSYVPYASNTATGVFPTATNAKHSGATRHGIDIAGAGLDGIFIMGMMVCGWLALWF